MWISSRCGDFTILRAAKDDFLPLKEPKQRALASYLIRKLQGPSRPILKPEFFESLSQHSLPTPAEASDNFLLLVAEEADGSPGTSNDDRSRRRGGHLCLPRAHGIASQICSEISKV